MSITVENFKLLFPNNTKSDIWVNAINSVLPAYQITDGPRLWMFLSQCGHESAGFTILSENLNYSAQRLLTVFPKYFTADLAARCDRKPEAIANIVYANRNQNGNSASGDGYRYRGRGPIQITFRANYAALSQDELGDANILLNNPDLLLQPEYGIRSAAWYFKKRNINAVSDAEDVLKATKLINGGTIGLEERVANYNKIKKLLA